jgi:hypothetical protein
VGVLAATNSWSGSPTLAAWSASAGQSGLGPIATRPRVVAASPTMRFAPRSSQEPVGW